MEKKIRILQVLTYMGRGGAESVVMNYYRALDKTKYQFDFLVHRKERGLYDDEIEAMGGKIYRAFPIRPWNYVSYFRFLDSFFKENASRYVAVHTHIQENSGFVLKYAYKYGIKNRLCTSHSAGVSYDLKYIFRLYASLYLHQYASIRLSCGVDAGRALYRKDNFIVLPNAIDTPKFAYSDHLSQEMRRELNLGDSLVIGNVARYSPEKNHAFTLKVLAEIKKKQHNVKLVLIGDGTRNESISNMIQEMNLEQSVCVLGGRNDVYRVLQCFDLLLFPSIFEGLPVSVIEAQASGLRCFLSDTIDKEVDITGDITFLSLNTSPRVWAEEILKSVPYERPNNQLKVEMAGYDVNKNIKDLLNLYTQGV